MVAGGAATQSAEIAQAATSDGTIPLLVSFGAIRSLPLSRQIRITNLGSGVAGQQAEHANRRHRTTDTERQ
jgi:hypothetical protein